MNERTSTSHREPGGTLEFDDTQALRALTAEGQLPPLLILSNDAQLIDVARKAAPSGMAITDAASVAEIADRLPSLEPGVLIIDTGGSRDVEVILPQLTQHFPEMVAIVVGNKEDSAALLRLTAEGRVFRFLLKPLSHGQARLAIKAATAQHIDLKSTSARRSAPIIATKSRNHVVAYSALAAAAVLAVVGVWYAIDRLTVEPEAPVADTPGATQTDPVAVPERVDPVVAELELAEEAFAAGRYLEPRGESALDLFRNALALDPNNEPGRLGVRRVADKVLEQAEAALTGERLEEATRYIETARDIDPTHSRLAFLDVQVARARERLRLTQKQGADTRVRTLLAQADEEMRLGRLIAPSSSNARRSLLSARKIDPTDPAVVRSIRSLATRLTEEAGTALAAGNLQEAETFVVAARELGSAGSALAAIERQLNQAKRAPRTPRPEAPGPATTPPESSVAGTPPPSAPESTAPPAATPTPTAPASVSNEPIEAIRIARTREVAPKYPREALLDRTEGYVDLEFTISPEGVPEDMVVRASYPRRTFDRAATDAVRRWRFQPVMRDGLPVAQRARLRLEFKP